MSKLTIAEREWAASFARYYTVLGARYANQFIDEIIPMFITTWEASPKDVQRYKSAQVAQDLEDIWNNVDLTHEFA